MKVDVIAAAKQQAEPHEQPHFSASVAAGFPSPADDHMETKLDLNRHLIQHPAATFFVKVAGDSMEGAAICSGDMLVVDRALDARHGDIVIAIINGEFTVKRLKNDRNGVWLVAEHPEYPPIPLDAAALETGGAVWGVVSSVVRKLK